MEAPTVKITRVRVAIIPQHDVFHVMLSTEKGEYPQTLGSESEVRTYLEGVRAALSFFGFFLPMPEMAVSAMVEPSTMARFNS